VSQEHPPRNNRHVFTENESPGIVTSSEDNDIYVIMHVVFVQKGIDVVVQPGSSNLQKGHLSKGNHKVSFSQKNSFDLQGCTHYVEMEPLEKGVHLGKEGATRNIMGPKRDT
jgi:hypothetical protein